MKTIDLRSDTVTLPSAAMREYMANANVGDDVYGEDETVNALEARVARMLNKESALLCTSGTQSNLLALLSQCQRGEEYLVGEEYHTYRYEAGGAAVLGGIVPQTVAVQADGTLDLEVLAKKVKPNDPHFPVTRLLALENTHTGKVMPTKFLDAARDFTQHHGLKLHLDGARLFNAHIASGASLETLTDGFDSVSVCFSKGLGAPIGSVLAADRETIAKARRWRKMLGGGMRQAGFVAAAIDYAIDHHIQRLQVDHDNAVLLATKLKAQLVAHGIEQVQVEPAVTNMVYVQFTDPVLAQKTAAHCRQKGIMLSSAARMRLVTHLNVTSAYIDLIVEEFIRGIIGD
ncbi:low-specificity L-threonine aldolase [Aliidiomarina haloalkalitolerans]|uniref:Low-specificity L-threonine aldolase n=1 Tax=Aliidiomarina haloalkalitolerans TaxID=859059 RepID=A0A432VY19_9GAMM|nr:low-specificity L-threonine aldolase [Aliidiomarina haloalkalitolerans]MCL4409826.1 low-specificity L-threonine aldolase [Gammaproteobacteria bacterium]RUO21603.1 low-specificity L-threonine aldolase [Aliidiomarina haloalkalitolerans]